MNIEARWAEFESRMDALVTEFGDVLGPKQCAIHGRDRENCDHTLEEAGEPVPGILMQDWLLIHRWSRLDGEGGYWDYHTSSSVLQMDAIGMATAVRDRARDALRHA